MTERLNIQPCVLCGKTVRAIRSLGGFEATRLGLISLDCQLCGGFTIDDHVANKLKVDADCAFRLACIAQEHRNRGDTGHWGIFKAQDTISRRRIDLSIDRTWALDQLLAEFPTATQIINRALLNLSGSFAHPMERKRFQHKDLSFLFFCPSTHLRVQRQHMVKMGLIVSYGDRDLPNPEISIAPEGWRRIDELSRIAPDSGQAFVAMWFDDSTYRIYAEGIATAVTDAGYEPKRIDRVEHNNKICDEIVAEIRKSRFVIADFTEQRGGVYFEAGFAMGLGLPVIWLVPEEKIEELHFDTRQYAHILYTDPEDLREKLRRRIEATIT